MREFLTSRRAKVTPEQAGLPAFGGGRRVKGLRRGEVAQLAGVSVEYYTRLERGQPAGRSESVLDALARALQLDEAERAHLFDLARAANATPNTRRRPVPPRVRPGIQRVVDAITAPAWVRNGRSDFMASNRLARALYAPVFDDPVGRPANTARFAFLDPRASRVLRRLGAHRERHRRRAARRGRPQPLRPRPDRPGRGAVDAQRGLPGPVGRARRAVPPHRASSGCTTRSSGDLDLTYEAMEFPSDPGLTLLVYTAEPSSPTADALDLLASWAATAGPGGTGRPALQEEQVQSADADRPKAPDHGRRATRPAARATTPGRTTRASDPHVRRR